MELDSIPLEERACKEVPPPPLRPLDSEDLFPKHLGGVPDTEALKSHLIKEGKLLKEDVLRIVFQARESFKREKNLLRVSEPVNIVGDVHGQFYDLVNLLDIGGDSKYLFLGDYVDRGCFSLEVVMLLFALKIKNPTKYLLLRGNHESRQMTTHFNFRKEIISKLDIEVYDAIMETFDFLPLACVVNNQFFAVHGGISPEFANFQELETIHRTSEPPRKGAICDLLWADPVEDQKVNTQKDFLDNNQRGCSFRYGKDAVSSFLKKNKLLSVIRAHEVQAEGYKMHNWKGKRKFPMVITIFSAPNYCDVYQNKGAIIKLKNNSMNIHQYNNTPHPYVLGNFEDIFTWSIPFVVEKTMQVMLSILKKKPPTSTSDLPTHLNELESAVKESKKTAVKRKIRAVTKMISMFRNLREEQDLVLKLKGMCPDNKIPRGLLQEGIEAMQSTYEAFSRAREWDLQNEKRPE